MNKPDSTLYPIFRYFAYDHLPPHLQKISKPFHDLAAQMINTVQDGEGGPEKAAGLRKLLEAKDCFVRAGIKKEDPFQYDLQVFYKIIVANELGNDMSLVLKFSDADGVRTGKSGYSFGVSQFDIAHNQSAIECLQECGFTTYEIDILKKQEATKLQMLAYENLLAANSHIVDKWDKAQIKGCLDHSVHLLVSSGLSLWDTQTLYHIADYHNQFYFSNGGKLHKWLMNQQMPITSKMIVDFKLNETAWGKKRPDDVKRRYVNIVEICNAK